MRRTAARRRLASVGVLAVAGVLPLLAACGGGSSGSDEPGPAPTTTATPFATPSAGPATPTPQPTATASGPPALRLSQVASGLDQPLYVTSAPGDDGRLYVVEQTGRIRIATPSGVLAAPFLDLSGRISCCGERGLLGLAFHPGYADNGRFFVNYTNQDGDTEVVEFERSADPDVASPAQVRLFFTVDQPFPNHNGGMLAFGPDGYLYVGMGDGGSAGDPQNNGQSLDTKLGKILRIDVDAYPTPPPGNVEGGDPAVWDWGLRNPWRFSFDRATGDLYIGDVGQNRLEEIDVEPAGQGRRNYGWRIMEGDSCFEPRTGCDQSGLTPPVVSYDRGDGCSVTGGYVYRGQAIPGLVGDYLYGDFCSNRVFSFRWSDGVATPPRELTDDLDPDGLIQGLTSFGEDAVGELYVVSQGGSVFRIEAE